MAIVIPTPIPGVLYAIILGAHALVIPGNCKGRAHVQTLCRPSLVIADHVLREVYGSVCPSSLVVLPPSMLAFLCRESIRQLGGFPLGKTAVS